MNITELKKQLLECLKADELDNTRILSLTHQIANLDEDKIRFSVDAGVIDRLGQELVARQETAVSELVKNSYDADAVSVSLEFCDSKEVGGTLIINDDGGGMSRDDLINGFMRISSTYKIHEPKSPIFKRHRAGQKGIGRFSVQRLGRKLTIITQTEDSHEALKLVIDWDQYNQDDNLFIVENRLEIIPKTKQKGTTLIIEQLRDKWGKASIKRVYRYVSDIIKPIFPTERNIVNEQDTEKFEVDFYEVIQGKKYKVADTNIMLYQHAVATLIGEIDDEGYGSVTINSKRLNIIEEKIQIGFDPDDMQSTFPNLRDVKFKVLYFIYDSDLINKMHSTSIRHKLAREGGLKLYRNGFRVLPYGEQGDDWLRLDESVRRRVILAPHGNINFYGFVELSDPNNLFNETSSREGLIDNERVRELKNFLHRALVTAVTRVGAIRGKKVVTSQKKDGKNWIDIDIRIKNIALSLDELDRELDGEEKKVVRRKTLNKIKKDMSELKQAHELEIKKTIQERAMLRVLSSIGITISQFIHEIKYYMDNIHSDIDFLLVELEGEDDQHTSLETVKILKSNFDAFKNYTAYFNTVVSANLVRELNPLNIREVVNSFISSMEHDAERLKIEFLPPKFNKVFLYTKPMHPSEWSSILFNFYTNAKKAIAREKVKGRILIECGEENGSIFLEFSDNGDGIKAEDEALVFDEFFTTTSASSLDDINQSHEVIGTGLGLKIVKDIVKSHRGNVEVVSAKADFSTCFRVEVPKASDKELSEYGL
ncbi:sensor histidine kinase [Acinetobacter schindleri]|uniref:sensor histidine kinase n=1 Tax=Acinetobacter schindleri TaxID=108981 RepID=UPI00289FED67|nr:sensor histidine kinase [Acinetobacter schindleri]